MLPALSRRVLLFGSTGLLLCAAPGYAQTRIPEYEGYFTRQSEFDPNLLLRAAGLTATQFLQANDEVGARVFWDREIERIDADPSIAPRERLRSLGKCLRHIVDGYCTQRRLDGKDRLLKQWLVAKACCAYVVTHLDYDFAVTQRPVQERNALAAPENVLAQPYGQRKTMCVGFALLGRDLARAAGEDLGLKACFAGSFYRDLGGVPTVTSNHALTGFLMDRGVVTAADLTTPRMKLREMKSRATAPREDRVMPFTAEARELFLAMNYPADETPPSGTNHGDPQNFLKLARLNLGEWKQARTDHLKPLGEWMTRQFDGRARWLEVPPDKG